MWFYLIFILHQVGWAEQGPCAEDIISVACGVGGTWFVLNYYTGDHRNRGVLLPPLHEIRQKHRSSASIFDVLIAKPLNQFRLLNVLHPPHDANYK